eukprot:gnl/MRDRNA2_/MRDRNA2_31194_c0_seq1.p1 gnl/MRDRNA2_/MRDRNA2_31194_c0~~gnl/MRDRNA2_/MRDRNA2_31194_c0_seq1.p1  ORF type:complete len:1246 (-),score=261.21 gnl/MRDRNA2_/MRDRNA2_31194_c0_seq1:40-3777(-)
MPNIKVAVRARPLNARELNLNSACVVSMQGESVVVATGADAPKTFTYDYAYFSVHEDDPRYATQENVYDDIGKVLLQNGIDGYNGCIFAYGQTGSGKSYSITGSSDQPGVVPRLVEEMFQNKESIESEGKAELRVWVTFIEIYNEHIRDLLSVGEEPESLHLYDHPTLGVNIPGVTESPCVQTTDVQKLLDFGTKKRVVAATSMNAESSRSHAVFTFRLQHFDGAPPESTTPSKKKKDERRALTAKINVVDLAGSERQGKTGATGHVLKEGCAINKSLALLGLVIKELTKPKVASSKEEREQEISELPGHENDFKEPKKEEEKEAMVPFRNSKLTFLLKDSLSGNSITFMLATISPARDNVEETCSTLRFASSVKKIKTVAVQNLSEKDKIILQLKEEIKKLKAQVLAGGSSALEKDIEVHEQLCEHFERDYDSHLEAHSEMNSARDGVLKGMGLSSGDVDDLMGVGKDTPYMLNVSHDPMLSGNLIYVLPCDTLVSVGSDPENSDKSIVLQGLGIPPQLCSLRNEQNARVFLEVTRSQDVNRRVVVNGRAVAIDRPTLLKNGDQILFGRACEFQLHLPAEAQKLRDEVKKREAAVPQSLVDMRLDDSESFSELSAAMKVPLSEAIVLNSNGALPEACHLVDEANEITREVRKLDGLRLKVSVLWDSEFENPENSIVIRVMRFGDNGKGTVLYYWTLSKLRERIEMMRDAYHSFHQKGSWDGKDSLEDPWIELGMEHRLQLSMSGHIESVHQLPLIQSVHKVVNEDDADDGAWQMMAPGAEGPGDALSTSQVFVDVERNQLEESPSSNPSNGADDSNADLTLSYVKSVASKAISAARSVASQEVNGIAEKSKILQVGRSKTLNLERSTGVQAAMVGHAKTLNLERTADINGNSSCSATENLEAMSADEKLQPPTRPLATQVLDKAYEDLCKGVHSGQLAEALSQPSVLEKAYTHLCKGLESGQLAHILSSTTVMEPASVEPASDAASTFFSRAYADLSKGIQSGELAMVLDANSTLASKSQETLPQSSEAQVASNAVRSSGEGPAASEAQPKKRQFLLRGSGKGATGKRHPRPQSPGRAQSPPRAQSPGRPQSPRSRERAGSPKPSAASRGHQASSSSLDPNCKDEAPVDTSKSNEENSEKPKRRSIAPRSPRMGFSDARFDARLAQSQKNNSRLQKLEVVWHGSVRLRVSPNLDDKAEEMVYKGDILTGVETRVVGTTLWWRLDNDRWIPMTSPDKQAIIQHSH